MSREGRLGRFSHLPLLDPATGILSEAQAALWPQLGDIPEPFVLYGGTALAMRLGHRESVDFDFFSAQSFSPTDLLAEFAWLGRVTINRSSPSNLEFTTARDVRFSFLGGMSIQCVAEPSIVEENGLVVASVFDLGGTKAKAILDRSEWKDYVDIATLLRNDQALADIIGYATAIFDPLFEFPAAAFLRSLVYFDEGTAADVPAAMKRELEAAVVRAEREPIPVFEPYSTSILP
ncbi:MAG: nucleotidyl transferase AbiEii/AbiGii toxin family protein [Candidatus Limnocylindrales bacterium]